jgi:hypothetical protein
VPWFFAISRRAFRGARLCAATVEIKTIALTTIVSEWLYRHPIEKNFGGSIVTARVRSKSKKEDSLFSFRDAGRSNPALVFWCIISSMTTAKTLRGLSSVRHGHSVLYSNSTAKSS